MTARLDSPVTIARLDPWTSELVGRLADIDALTLDALPDRARAVLDAGRAAYRRWQDAAPGTDKRVAEAAVGDLVAECASGSGTDEAVSAARDWTALVLLERIDDHSLPMQQAALRLIQPACIPQKAVESIDRVPQWWARRGAL